MSNNCEINLINKQIYKPLSSEFLRVCEPTGVNNSTVREDGSPSLVNPPITALESPHHPIINWSLTFQAVTTVVPYSTIL